jgi:hypothetical protein
MGEHHVAWRVANGLADALVDGDPTRVEDHSPAIRQARSPRRRLFPLLAAWPDTDSMMLRDPS